ncbi:hypothetical protein F3P66_02470 [Agrobacterium fabrum]|uniref:Uncharacterized protein n=1 Tax=Agrobacterium fabrum (strain C58 / ATCC 33970) TaxID=176299 RepID=Q8UCX6_AGRFC|nr:hypothetical protein Atu2357 [Agrobacterium fabrum str. C58]QRM60558.1 hypothetical protein F3P66_02470 [Agrobacterium fabrum]TRB29426.1 hypothetical protein EXN51_11645 [Agrobacterium fabrum]
MFRHGDGWAYGARHPNGQTGPSADCPNAAKDELAAVHSALDQDGYPIARTTAASRKNNSDRRVLQILSIF